MRARFREITNLVAEQIASGEIKPGDQLPTHRALAYSHGISLATATRVYSELDALGLTIGEVGRGTFARVNSHASGSNFAFFPPKQDDIDFSRNHMVLPEQLTILQHSISDAFTSNYTDLLGYRENSGSKADRDIAAQWINESRAVNPVGADQVTICSGGQHALLLCLMAICQPGSTIAVEEHTYPGFRVLADILRLELVAVKSDGNGLLPDELSELCKSVKIRALFLMPNLQNPTSSILGLSRREEIAEIVRRYNLYLIEDDAYGFLLPNPPKCISELIPDRVFYLRTMSKSWAPGLRICYLVSPQKAINRVTKTQRASIWMSTPLMMSVASNLIISGEYDNIVRRKRHEIRKRQAIIHKYLPEEVVKTDLRSMHVWIDLPIGCRSETFLLKLKSKGVVAAPVSQFEVAETSLNRNQAIRLCIGAPEKRSEMQTGILKIAGALKEHRKSPHLTTTSSKFHQVSGMFPS